MIIGCKQEKQTSLYKTKKELVEELEANTAAFYKPYKNQNLRTYRNSINEEITGINIQTIEEEKPDQPIVKRKSYLNFSEIKKQIDPKRKEEEEEQARGNNSKVLDDPEVSVQSNADTVEADTNHKKKRDIKENKTISIFSRTIGSLLMFISGFSIPVLILQAVICGDPTWIAIFFFYFMHLFSIGMADKRQNEWKITPLIFFPRSQAIKAIYYLLIVCSVISFIIALEDQSGFVCSCDSQLKKSLPMR
tara:strand:- start:500 stop:1246 length:747 start_codon:yes stop_codon:yes gene_type:complete